jgi:hypothetical protein
VSSVPGGSYYAVLPVTFALYLAFAVFAMNTLHFVGMCVCACAWLVVESLFGYAIGKEGEYFWLFLSGLVIFGAYVGYTLEVLSLQQWRLKREAIKQKKKIKIRQKESDDLLNNIVPAALKQDLQSFEDMSGIARKVDNVSILFSDISGFTMMSSGMKPQKLVWTMCWCCAAIS